MANDIIPTLTAAERRALEKQRTETEESLPPDSVTLLEWARKWRSDGSMLILKQAWVMGKKLNEALGDARKYGEKVVDKIAICLNVDKSGLYKAAHFQRTFDEKELENLISLRMAGTDAPLTLTHVYELITITDKTDRNKFLAKTVNNAWAPNILALAIRENLNRPAHAGGRKQIIPRTAAGVLDNMDKVVATFNRNHTVIYANDEHGILASVNDMAPDRITAEFVQKLDDSEALLQKARDNIDAELQLITAAKEVAVAKLAAQSQQDAVADADLVGAK